jgi:hypothetical protein
MSISTYHAPLNPAIPAMVETANRVTRITHPTLADCTRAMCEASFELTGEEAALLLLAINEAALGGYNFTALELALVDVIRRQLAGEDCDLEDGGDAEPDIIEDVDDDSTSAELTDGDGLYWPRPTELVEMTRADNRRRRLGQNVEGFVKDKPVVERTLAQIITGRPAR